MFNRARNLRRLGLVCLIATLGCKPDPVPPTTDPEPAADPGGPTDVSGASTDASDTTDASDASTDASYTTDVASAEGDEGGEDEGGEAAGDGGGDAGQPADAAAKTVAEKEPLPKPAHELRGPTCQKSFNVGNKVKGFKLPSVDGKKNITPGNFRKRVVLLNFWGTWCKPCLKELPEFDRLYRKYRKHGLTLVAVATDEDPEPVQAFIDKHKLRAKVALEGEEYAGTYNRPNFPFSFVVDGNGTIVAAYEYIDDNCMGDLEQVIRDELEKL